MCEKDAPHRRVLSLSKKGNALFGQNRFRSEPRVQMGF